MDNNQNNNRLVAKLVAQYGFACILDMLAFSNSLDNSFKKWAENVLFSRSSIITSNIFHDVSFGGRVVNLNILNLLPKKWIHVYHVTFLRAPSKNPFQLSSTIITEAKPLESYCHVTYVWDRKLVTAIMKTFEGKKFYSDHSRHTADKYHFVVIMKNE